MDSVYIQKLEKENEKLHQERSQMYAFFKAIAANNPIKISQSIALNAIQPYHVINYAIKHYCKASHRDSYTFEVNNIQFHYTEKSTDAYKQELIVNLFKAIYDNYHAKKLPNTLSLVLDMLDS
jgi:hypothetical protein